MLKFPTKKAMVLAEGFKQRAKYGGIYTWWGWSLKRVLDESGCCRETNKDLKMLTGQGSDRTLEKKEQSEIS